MAQYIPKPNRKEKGAPDEASAAGPTPVKVKRRTLLWVGGALLIIIALVSVFAFRPGKYDAFAKCLTEKKVVMYGEDWCPYTQAQKNMFGKSFKYVDYQVKTGLRVRPTWVIDDKLYERVQSFETLSALSGCDWRA